MSRSFLPAADGALLQWGQNFSNLLTANFAAYGIVQPLATSYASVFNTYKTALTAAKADSTRGKSTVYAKEQAKNALITFTRQVAGQINRTISVTNQQRVDLGLIVRKPPSPIPAPTSRPTMAMVSAIMRTVDVRVFDDSTQYKRGKAPGTIGAKVYTFVGADYPTDPTAWAYQGDTTNGKFAATFPDTVANGAQVWICAAWFNRRGQTGPVSLPISTNVQGGGSNTPDGELKMAA